MSDCESCDCALVSLAAKGMGKLFRERAGDLVKPLPGIGRDSQIRDTQALGEAAKELHALAKAFTKGKQTPIKGSQFLSSGVSGTLDSTLERFDEISKEALWQTEHVLATGAPVEKYSKILNQVAEAFNDLGDRLAISCSIKKNLL